MPTKEEVIAALQPYAIGDKYSDMPGPRASVLVPLFVKDGQLHTLMTLRSEKLRMNAGQVCFPGGKRDPGDRDDVHTALREAEEEIGLSPDSVEVVCTMAPAITKSGLLAMTVVGFIDPSFSPRPNPAEVSAVFSVPLDFFTREKNHTAAHGVAGTRALKHSFHYLDPESGQRFHISGLTALLAIGLARLALKKETEFFVGFKVFFQQSKFNNKL